MRAWTRTSLKIFLNFIKNQLRCCFDKPGRVQEHRLLKSNSGPKKLFHKPPNWEGGVLHTSFLIQICKPGLMLQDNQSLSYSRLTNLLLQGSFMFPPFSNSKKIITATTKHILVENNPAENILSFC